MPAFTVRALAFLLFPGSFAAALPPAEGVHWSYRPIGRPSLPAVEQGNWCRQPLDRFVLARLEERGLRPAPEAERHTLVKRVYYDLLGLPPSPAELDAHLADASPLAHERLVEHLLSSPHFGERWGRHWLDKARYADSDGYEKDRPRPDAWRYRDWVIEAINRDLPFDRFTIEQLAGDLLPGAGPLERLATAFHRQTLTNTEGGTDREQFRVEAVIDRLNTVGTVWLGLTVGCAQCHSHKYDALTQREYYQLFAYLNNGEEVETEVPVSSGQESPLMKVRVIARNSQPRPTHVLERGDFLRPGEEVRPGTPGVLPPIESAGGGDRLDLARWLVDPGNPLTPRVAVNHVWKHLFGAGLVRTLNDFGARGERPIHPSLLDWLASEYVRLGWSRKALVRSIVTSSTYRQSSRHRPELAEIDPRNRLLHRQNRFRVEGEIVRDLALTVSDLLCRKIGGPSVFPPMPPEVARLSYANNFKWKTSDGEDRHRRGMYTFFKRTAPHPNLVTFDCPDANSTCVERDVSNTPLQALTLLNNGVFVEVARAFARALLEEGPASESRRLDWAFRRTLLRPPRPQESARFVELLAAAGTWYESHPGEARKLVGPCLPRGGTYRETAAWVATVRILLNLDEFVTRE